MHSIRRVRWRFVFCLSLCARIVRKLKEDEFVTTYLVDSGAGPARKYYRLTQKGRARQIQLKEEWEEFTHAVQSLIEVEASETV